ncbi:MULTISPECIES: SDR family oxidoreductase [Amycolatopsis]|uniref:Short-chain dehydrogenase/reductase n=1 Tax=Amycolatopsis bullii TaxID=941987 RepID=A0ABQ3KD88_9PSEU|nr:SDR family oxidoreductase [Amycolatopsis bullii]GHG14556.1 short-chain dehydrogenase/reductase [Amycolatopsis bullii]
MSRVWFITGTSRGFGRVWAEAALGRGDQVAATARNTGALADLVDRYGEDVLPIALDVTDKSAVEQAVKTAHAHFGRLDVVVNNAGYGLFAMTEEVTEQQARDQFETNVFGALWVTQAVLPHLREQGSGHIVQVSSIGGLRAFPNLGVYNASKWALEGLGEALAAEVAGFGIKVTLVEPGGYATDWGGSSAVRSEGLPAYDGVREAVAAFWSGSAYGDPQATAPAILRMVDAEEPPLRVFFGAGLLDLMREEYARRIEGWEKWNQVSEAAMGSGS